MLSGIRLVASAAAGFRGGCTSRLGRPAGQRSLVGFIRFLSDSSKDEIPASKIRLTLKNIRDYWQNSIEPLNFNLRVYIPTVGEQYCYLGTQHMSMRYQTPQETITWGNHSLHWLARRDEIDKNAVHFSNFVTDDANKPDPPPPAGTPETFLQDAYQITAGEYYLQGDGVKFYFEEQQPGEIAIYSYLDGTQSPPVKYYLQPSIGDNTIIAKVGAPQYVFVVEPII